MLMSIEELKKIYTDKDFSKFSDDRLKMKLEAIEIVIRNYTHNNFQNIDIRTDAISVNNYIFGSFLYFKVGDTVQITNSRINDGLYTIVESENGAIKLDRDIYDSSMTITKIEYPIDVIDGAIELLDWECNQKGKKQGISSETISRHSVSYKQYDEKNTVEGFPSELFKFAKKYIRWVT